MPNPRIFISHSTSGEPSDYARKAFPNDEPSGEVIASRLRADGIAARVDRGLSAGIWQVSSRGQVTVLVDEAVAARAHKILGTTPKVSRPPTALRFTSAFT